MKKRFAPRWLLCQQAATTWFFCLLGTNLPAGELAAARRSPHTAVEPVPLCAVRWHQGFWADRLETCRSRSLPAMWELMRGTHYKPFYQHFLIAAGELDGDFHGAAWNDGDFYKFLEAVVAVWSQTQDRELESILETSITAIAAAQREDGYIHTPVLIRQRNGDRHVRPFEDRHNFEMYNMGHLMITACTHHRLTGRENFLEIARRTADFLYETFRDPTPELARNSVCPAHYMGIVELYRATGEPRYLELARIFFEMRNLSANGGDDNQDRIPFTQQREAVGHAVRANYLYAGAADLFLETGDPSLWLPLEALWENVVQKKMYITGACGALYDGASPDGSTDQAEISRVHQAYGRNYQLPSLTAHGETCANIGNVLWNWRMFLGSGEARYVDVVELALYNSVLSGMSLEGTDYFYVNPLRNVDPLPTQLRWSRSRVPFVTSYCCPPNLLRTIAKVGEYAYSKKANAIFVNLYGGNTLSTTLEGDPIELTQETNYPWDGQIRFTLTQAPAATLALHLRIPGWTESATISLNGTVLDIPAPIGRYATVKRKWQAGDVLELDMPMAVQLVEAHPLVEETRNQVAVKRGPVVYCLESTDLPEGINLQDVLVPIGAKWKTEHETDLLQGVTVLTAHVLARPPRHWRGPLYQPARTETLQSVKAQFIPYYAWANRGAAEMSVWLPVQR